MIRSNYDKVPQVKVSGMDDQCWSGWKNVMEALSDRSDGGVVVIECYVGVSADEIVAAVRERLPSATIFESENFFHEPEEIERKVAPFLGKDDPIFGYHSALRMEDFFSPEKLTVLHSGIESVKAGPVVVIGPGASIVHPGDVLVYAEMPRWEAQGRMRRNEMSNLGIRNRESKWSLQYKRAFFNDWPV